MSVGDIFLNTIEDFNKNTKFVNDVFCINNKLPEKVFNDSYCNFLFEEFDWTMSSGFWNIIKNIATITNDKHVITAVLNPHPVDYYYKNFKYFNWAEIPVEFEGDVYCEFIEKAPKLSEVDSIIYNSNTIVWTSPTSQWGIWGERSCGICIIAFKKGVEMENILPVLQNWQPVEKAIESWISVNFKGQKVPDGFKQRIISNYRLD